MTAKEQLALYFCGTLKQALLCAIGQTCSNFHSTLLTHAACCAALLPLRPPLPLQVLGSQSSFSALAELQSFDEAVNRLTAQQLSAHQPQLQAGAIAAAGSSGAGLSARSRASAVAGASASAGLSEALDGARRQLQAGRQQQQEEPQPPLRTELDVSGLQTRAFD